MSHSEIDRAPSPKRPKMNKAANTNDAVGVSLPGAGSESMEIRALVRSTVLEDSEKLPHSATTSQDTTGQSLSGEHHQQLMYTIHGCGH